MTEPGRVLALDIGTKRIGMALSDEMRIIAQPFGMVERDTPEQDCGALKQVIAENRVVEVLVGLPKRLDGSHGEMADVSKFFAGWLREHCNVNVRLWDERFSTHAAERMLLQGNVRRAKRKKVVDQTAAAWILQGYLDSRSGL